MKALELSNALRDIANLYDNPDVIFYSYSDFGTEDIDVDAVYVVDNVIILDDETAPVLFDLVYKKGGEWKDGKTSRD